MEPSEDGFSNNEVRIGPTGVQTELFKMPGRNGKIRNGTRFDIPIYLAEQGLNTYEFPGGRMSTMNNSEDYQKFKENAKNNNIAISFHAPYYISFTSLSEETFDNSIERLANCFLWATYIGAKRIVVHPGSYNLSKSKSKKSILQNQALLSNFGINKQKEKSSTPQFTEHIQKLLNKIAEGIKKGVALAYTLHPELKDEFDAICVCPETMGKQGQLGTLNEVIYICKKVGLDRARPCIDFGHLYARNNGSKKYSGKNLYNHVFNTLERELGKEIIDTLHIHYSHIAYTEKGEKMHVPNTNEDWGPKFHPLIELIKERKIKPIIINESPDLDPDAKLLMGEWISIK